MFFVVNENGKARCHFYGEPPIMFDTVAEAAAFARDGEPYLGAWRVWDRARERGPHARKGSLPGGLLPGRRHRGYTRTQDAVSPGAQAP